MTNDFALKGPEHTSPGGHRRAALVGPGISVKHFDKAFSAVRSWIRKNSVHDSPLNSCESSYKMLHSVACKGATTDMQNHCFALSGLITPLFPGTQGVALG